MRNRLQLAAATTIVLLLGVNDLSLSVRAQSASDADAVPILRDQQVVTPVPQAINADNFSADYTAITKKILLAGIEIERFSLKFRLESAKPPRFRKLRFFATQETGAAGALAYEIVALDQFNVGRKRPLQLDKGALKSGLRTTMITSTIAASGSAYELTSNLMRAVKNRKAGYDQHSANQFVATKIKEIDRLLDQRDALVAANATHPSYARAVAEGKVMRSMRSAFLSEYSQFSADIRGFQAFQNAFFFLNAATNTIGAVSAGIGVKSVDRPTLTGTANVLFILTGAMAAATPMLSTTAGAVARYRARRSLEKLLHEKPNFDFESFTAERQHLEQQLSASAASEGSLIPSLPATQRFALYTQSEDLFRKQLDSETRIMRKLDKVALQSSFLAPAIGGTLATQGILGSVAYFKYPLRPRKNLKLNYYGAISGTVGAGMSVVGNAAFLLASYAYERRLYKQKKLPSQLIEARLRHLDEVEKVVIGL